MLRLQELQTRFMAGLSSPEEIEEWRTLLQMPEHKEKAMEIFREVYGMDPFADLDPERAGIILQHIMSTKAGGTLPADSNEELPYSPPRIHFLKTIWLRYAAIIILVLGSGSYLWFRYTSRATLVAVSSKVTPDVPPGKEGAVLTLADGSQVVLDSMGNGLVATQNGIKVMLKNGRLTYDVAGKSSEDIVFNTMTTPRGRQFNITLPDGTKVWLNAASSLRYPTAFSGTQRRVEITGEAYFEVMTDKNKPFYASINGKAEVEVLGTGFNVTAYDDEPSINTTLLEGAIRVIKNGRPSGSRSAGNQGTPDEVDVILKPGQQARIGNETNGSSAKKDAIDVENADLEKVTAWRKGMFNFEGITLKSAMLQLSRWYDIEVVYDKEIYEKGLQNLLLAGEIRRDLSLANVVELLNVLGLKFRIEQGGKLLVSP